MARRRSRWSRVLGGLVLVGAALAVGAMVARRLRTGETWHEVTRDPASGQDRQAATSDERPMVELARTAMSEVAESGARVGLQTDPVGPAGGRERTSDLIGAGHSHPERRNPR